MVTMGALIQDAARRLGRCGIETARLDARVLLAAATGRSPADLVAHDSDLVPDATRARYESLIIRRAARVPVSHIVGEREFWSLRFRVTGATLAPRPDSETLVEAVIAARRDRPPRRILDLGTGTGCLLLALLREFPGATGVGIDRCPEAARVARENAIALGLGARAVFVAGDWTEALSPSAGFDVVTSNPPYISRAELSALDPEVRDHEPHLALDGGDDGLDAYRRIVPAIPSHIAPGGLLALEIGPTQGADVTALARLAGADRVGVKNDLAGRDRVVMAEFPFSTGKI